VSTKTNTTDNIHEPKIGFWYQPTKYKIQGKEKKRKEKKRKREKEKKRK
jgi:hypothetical protein